MIWADFNGVTRQTVITSTSGGGAVWAALQAASKAQVLTTWESLLGAAVGTATSGSYQSNKVSASLVFQTAAGDLVRLTLPAPDLSIFMADGLTVDPANTLVVAIITAAVGTLTDPAGNAVVSYVGGYLNPSRNDLPPVI